MRSGQLPGGSSLGLSLPSDSEHILDIKLICVNVGGGAGQQEFTLKVFGSFYDKVLGTQMGNKSFSIIILGHKSVFSLAA